jgi:hypothetical protein
LLSQLSASLSDPLNGARNQQFQKKGQGILFKSGEPFSKTRPSGASAVPLWAKTPPPAHFVRIYL